MNIKFKTYDNDKIMAEKIMHARRAEGQIITIARELRSQGIILKEVNIVNPDTSTAIVDVHVII